MTCAVAEQVPERPTIVCLCGSTRFAEQFQMTYLAETLAGRIVLSVATAPGGDEALFTHLEPAERARLTEMLAQLHRHKIDLADEVLIVSVGGYIGPSTARELSYARARGKRVRFLEDESEMEKGPIIR